MLLHQNGMTHTHQQDKTSSAGPTSMLQPRLDKDLVLHLSYSLRNEIFGRAINSCRSGVPPYHWFPPRHKPRQGSLIVRTVSCAIFTYRKLTPAVLQVVPSFSCGATSYRVLSQANLVVVYSSSQEQNMSLLYFSNALEVLTVASGSWFSKGSFKSGLAMPSDFHFRVMIHAEWPEA